MDLSTHTSSVLTIGSSCEIVVSCAHLVWTLGGLSYTWNLRSEARDKGEWVSSYVAPCDFSNAPSQIARCHRSWEELL